MPNTSVPVRTNHSWAHPVLYAMLIVPIAALVRWLLFSQLHIDAPFLVPVSGIAFASMIGGLVPGFAATLLLAGFEAFEFRHQASLLPVAHHVWWLIEGGVLMSVVSGQVHAAQRRARISDDALLDLERKVLEISDEERRRIGHDLHDGLGQHLTGISLLSTSLAHRIAHAAPDASKDAEKISALVTQSIGWTRDLARGLSPVTLEQEGLYAALEELADNARSLLGIQCALEFAGQEPAVEKAAGDARFSHRAGSGEQFREARQSQARPHRHRGGGQHADPRK